MQQINDGSSASFPNPKLQNVHRHIALSLCPVTATLERFSTCTGFNLAQLPLLAAHPFLHACS